MLKKADEIAVQIPSAQVVKEMVQQAKEWTVRAQILEVSKEHRVIIVILFKLASCHFCHPKKTMHAKN